MNQERTLNLLGALALSLVDGLSAATASASGFGGEAAAALVTLGVEPGLSIKRLGEILRLSHPGTVRLVDRLEGQGWVERRHGADGRTLALFLTATGIDCRQRILAARRQALQRAIAPLSSSDQEQLTALLEAMLAALTTDEQQAFAICRLCEEEVCPGDRCPVEQQYCRMVNP